MVTVRFTLRRTKNPNEMLGDVEIPALGFKVSAFESPSPNECGSVVDRDGSRLRLRCIGDEFEMRGEVTKEADGLRVRTAAGDFGANHPTNYPRFATTHDTVVALRCGATVKFEPHRLTDFYDPDFQTQSGFFRDLDVYDSY